MSWVKIGSDETKWRKDASCNGKPPEWWFPHAYSDFSSAVHVCRRCPVIDECRRFAVRTNQKHGIWGGIFFGRKTKSTRYGVDLVFDDDF